MEIKYVDIGIANTFSDGTIELNKNLKDYPKLHSAIINHELRHNKGFKGDLINDFGEDKIDYWQLTRFMLKHPKSFIQFLPFYMKDKTVIYDINNIIYWSAALGVMTLAIILAVKL